MQSRLNKNKMNKYYPQYHPEQQRIIDKIENERGVDLIVNDCGELCRIICNIKTKKYDTEIIKPR